ncbi:MAG: outer membrane beta-barrel protein, partial [Pseudolabrys sp.]
LSVLAAAAVGLTASMASAADLPRKAPADVPPVAPPIMTWTGCYIGGNVGGVFTRVEADFDFGEISHNNSGFTGGGQIGCDYQWAGGWVIGFRNMFNGTSGGGKTVTIDGFSDAAFNGATVNFSNQWFDALTARLGYAWSPAWLMYFQGGAVWSKAKAEITGFGNNFDGRNICNLSDVTCDFGSASKTRTGWTIGGGVEWRFAPQWSAFLEGNYYDFGNNDRILTTTTFGFGGCDLGCSFNTKSTAATVLVGVNWRPWSGSGGY